ncbi:MAG TPA: penicillin acylase family protein [Gemmatimonadaceae bacterium]|nr:penicillin acylase family protein [Gemmatimonadaceae bacterium]
MRPRLSLVAAVPVLVGTLVIGARPVGPLPPLGALLDPANGAWALGRRAEHPGDLTVRIAALDAPVRIVYDDRGVPHIFATTERDALRALGWAVARDRLFQLEVQSRAGGGTLTELVGPAALEADRATRAIGLAEGARRRLAAIPRDGREWEALTAYAEGVNAWIDGLRPRDRPLEYRLLGARPSRWEPINSMHLLGRMGWTLAWNNDELLQLRARAVVGAAAADALFPIHSPIQEPIQPSGGRTPRDDFRPPPPPGPPEEDARLVAHAIAGLLPPPFAAARAAQGDAVGSNNWAVAGRRTRDGHALLAGDPHLELTLPSIWYEAHIVIPGELDVYGVTLPGAPMIVIGFNRDIAWTFTNTQADVVDLWREMVDDSLHPGRHRLDGTWRAIEPSVERYVDRRGRVLAIDTLRATHRGPLRRVGGQWLSMRWTVLEPAGEIEAFLGAMRARTAREFLDATESFAAPAQNMLVADRSGTIAIRSAGRYPLRSGDGRGDLIRSGESSSEDWRGEWPLARYPQAIDPIQGFLASANQQPKDSRDDPGYLGSNWPSPWRAIRINELLRADSAVTVETMRRMQTDPGSPRADRFVPAFVAAARSRAGSAALARAAELLDRWDRRYTRENDRAVLFEYAMRELDTRLWDELRVGASPPPSPGDAVVAQLLTYPDSPWWDDRSTPEVERRDDILAASLEAALARAERMHGDPGSEEWRWSSRRQARIDHLLGVPALSARGIPVQGGPSTLSPSSGTGRFGASWRMVVELGPELKAWGIYPGGQSGNPMSRRYREHVAAWRDGALDTLRFPRTADEIRNAAARAELRPTGGGR